MLKEIAVGAKPESHQNSANRSHGETLSHITVPMSVTIAILDGAAAEFVSSSRRLESSRASPASLARSWIVALSSGFFGSLSNWATLALKSSDLLFEGVTRLWISKGGHLRFKRFCDAVSTIVI